MNIVLIFSVLHWSFCTIEKNEYSCSYFVYLPIFLDIIELFAHFFCTSLFLLAIGLRMMERHPELSEDFQSFCTIEKKIAAALHHSMVPIFRIRENLKIHIRSLIANARRKIFRRKFPCHKKKT
ncbi:hypothetical protein CEXT_811231 [Caerostris extrusa]|uniref:Uncharacterized protein n=1 Tax=Caerostris extrusa TaxID=172846 RepID=A0AAV4V715_CAEEX|nr:hypothetical protein CEXT_811231 [Caerostris extrusa]